ncbi:ATP-binding cassette domain-containing protein [Photobacterium lutimaris]|uniref:Methionine ABC transporter ATP-binding protein n=1 Tax=Photobacterium lutimaris TaxID=388278 RepID=A0A2T3IR58_9GAMM|nr:ATP-binding cassette domain-containing protein [Photobacterium lutimaris]PSU30841.1 methionine ABC transporter ATP-binding protein [Photobacterium lutimaris]TDR72073.1 putative ABC transport system ATP-binding protein [Photobacterium lutimaris]
MSIIEISELTFQWPRQTKPLLEIPSLIVNQGEKVFIKGPSGSGKSSLLSLLAGINEPTSGTIKLLGQPFSNLKSTSRDRFRADHIGYIFQMFNLLPYLSVIDNVLLPCRFSTLRKQQVNGEMYEQANQLLAQLHLPAECLNSPISELSIGQQQRVAAARALIGKPKLLIADEPTSALDHDNREAFIKLLMAECDKSDTTLLFVSHDETLEALFDRSINLNTINLAVRGQ